MKIEKVRFCTWVETMRGLEGGESEMWRCRQWKKKGALERVVDAGGVAWATFKFHGEMGKFGRLS